ncbi:MAG: glycosyltransferase family 39 protein, partial [Chloroflexi bacterium]|nr:glycosyltransferase family 39 protein [Chloroflexota bacterium]
MYPRWAPDFYYGYGYPFFNYYSPLTYYLGLAVELLPRLNAVHAVKAVFILGLLAAGVGLYGYVRDNWGRPAGLVAAAVYVFAPYVHYVDPHARGDLAESFSFGVFALALWAMDRLRRRPSPGRWLAAAGLVAAIILTHNLMAMVFFALLLAWAAWQLLAESKIQTIALQSHLKSKTLILFLPLLLGVGLAAFFWMPVALEREAVNLNTLIGDGGHFDFRNHFLSPGELLAPPRLLDWGATEPDFALNLGLAQWLLGGIGLLALLAGRAIRPGQARPPSRARPPGSAIFFALALAVLLFMMLPPSAFLWERIPFLPFLQFPWRLLGAAAAMLAVLAGVGTGALLAAAPATARPWLLAGLIGATLLLGFPLNQVPPWPADFGETTTRRLLEVELSGRWLGTTSTADFVPATVELLPGPEGSLLADLFAGRPPDRVNRATLRNGKTVTFQQVTPLHFHYYAASQRPFLLRLFLFYFPGWQAQVDGRPVELELGRPEGFVVVPVPAGQHQVDVFFDSTPPRNLALAVTALSLLAVLLVATNLARRPDGFSRFPAETTATNLSPQSLVQAKPEHVLSPWFRLRLNTSSVLVPALAVVLILALVYIFLVEPLGWLRYESTGLVAAPADYQASANFGEQMALLGYDAPGRPVSPGEAIRVILYWKAQRPLEINYQVFLHLLRPDGSFTGIQSDKLNPGEFPTRRWPLDKYVRDEHRLVLPPDLP